VDADDDRCGAFYPHPESGPCVFRRGHRGDLHKDADDGWWTDDQAQRAAEELVESVMDE